MERNRERRGFFPLLGSGGLHLNRRTVMGSLALFAGGVLSGCGARALGNRARRRGRVLIDQGKGTPVGLAAALELPLAAALLGRRARRFSMGAHIPDGVLAYESEHEPLPLTELEQMMVLGAATGNTGFNYMIMRHAGYAPNLSNYCAAAGGRTFPSPAAFHTTNFFYTDDDGLYYLPTRDALDLKQADEDQNVDLHAWLTRHRSLVRKLSDGRLNIPPEEPYMDGHNTWCVNRPGSTLLIPVGDLAQHTLLALSFLVQNGYCVYDDVHNEKIPGLARFSRLVDVDDPIPLTYVEQLTLSEISAEMAMSCYAGMLMLQAMGLGGWLFDGVNRITTLGGSGNPEVPGLGFRFDTDERWAVPNATGREGVFEAFCPPHVPDMRAAVEKVAARKFGPGGPYNPETPGPWKDTPTVRSAARVHSEEFKDCVAVMAQYVYDRFGKFPGTVPSVMILTYLQAHHLDLGFYDTHFKSGAYLPTHAEHMKSWH